MGSRRRHEPAPMNPAVVGACPEEWHGLMTKFLDAYVPRLTRIPVDPDALTKTKRALARAEAGRSGMTTASGTFGGYPSSRSWTALGRQARSPAPADLRNQTGEAQDQQNPRSKLFEEDSETRRP